MILREKMLRFLLNDLLFSLIVLSHRSVPLRRVNMLSKYANPVGCIRAVGNKAIPKPNLRPSNIGRCTAWYRVLAYPLSWLVIRAGGEIGVQSPNERVVDD